MAVLHDAGHGAVAVGLAHGERLGSAARRAGVALGLDAVHAVFATRSGLGRRVAESPAAGLWRHRQPVAQRAAGNPDCPAASADPDAGALTVCRHSADRTEAGMEIAAA